MLSMQLALVLKMRVFHLSITLSRRPLSVPLSIPIATPHALTVAVAVALPIALHFLGGAGARPGVDEGIGERKVVRQSLGLR